MKKSLDIKPLSFWDQIDKKRPLIISGPCSAETEYQVLQTAIKLKGIGIDIFRAGIWKPRTRPNSFEGVGSVGLQWLKNVQKETGMLVTTEVAKASHVEAALKQGIDILWIGARSVVNPFVVQEIADALKGVDIPVFVKNPVNPDIDLWIGAIERINEAGITKIGAIHRGFSSFAKEKYRNPPTWQIPIELKRRIHNIPLICDPSHMGGRRELISELSQRAIDLNYDGLMIESHIDPDRALSDVKQQLKPHEVKEVLDNLIIRSTVPADESFHMFIDELRRQIDQLDEDMISIFHSRMEIADKIGEFKKANKVTILQGDRWDELITSRLKSGETKGLSKDFMMKILKAIHQESINHQAEVMNRKREEI